MAPTKRGEEGGREGVTRGICNDVFVHKRPYETRAHMPLQGASRDDMAERNRNPASAWRPGVNRVQALGPPGGAAGGEPSAVHSPAAKAFSLQCTTSPVDPGAEVEG